MNETAGPKQEIIKNTPKKNEGIDISYSNKNWKVEFTLWDTKNLSQKELDFINRLLESKKEEANKMIEEITKNSWAKRRELANSIIKELKSRWERWNKEAFDALIARTEKLFSLSDGEKVAQTVENIASSEIGETASKIITWNKDTINNLASAISDKVGNTVDNIGNKINKENAKKVISSFNVEKDKWDIKKVEDLQKALLALWKKDLGKVDGKWWPLTQGALENYINDKVQIAKENDKKDTDFIKNLNPKINIALWTLSEKAGINYKNIIEWYIKLASSKPEAKQNIEDQIMNILNLIADPNIKDGFTEKWVKVRINKINEIPNILKKAWFSDKDIAQVQERRNNNNSGRAVV